MQNKKYTKQLLAALLCVSTLTCNSASVNACSNHAQEERIVTEDLKSELAKLKDNIKAYSEVTAQNIKNDAETYVNAFQDDYLDLEQDVQQEVSSLYDDAMEAYRRTKESGATLGKKTYNDFVAKMEKLNKAIEEASKN